MKTIHYAIYDPLLGEIVRHGNCPVDQVDDQHVPDGMKMIKDTPANPSTHYVKNDQLVAYTESQALNKRARAAGHVWSNGTMMWHDPRNAQAILDAKAQKVRDERDALLARSDWTVTVATENGAGLSDTWKAYRQALRDVTKQPGFPEVIVWPSAPTAQSANAATAPIGTNVP